MAWRSGSLSRTLMSTVRSSSSRSNPSLPQLRTPPVTAPRRLPARHFSATSRPQDDRELFVELLLFSPFREKGLFLWQELGRIGMRTILFANLQHDSRFLPDIPPHC